MLKWSVQHNSRPDLTGETDRNEDGEARERSVNSAGAELPPQRDAGTGEDGSRFHLVNWLKSSSSSNSLAVPETTVPHGNGQLSPNNRHSSRLLLNIDAGSFSPMTVYGSLNRMRSKQSATKTNRQRYNSLSPSPALGRPSLSPALAASRSSSSSSDVRRQPLDPIMTSSVEASAISHHNYRYNSTSNLLDSYLIGLSPGSKRHSAAMSASSPRHLAYQDFVVTQSVGRKHGLYISNSGSPYNPGSVDRKLTATKSAGDDNMQRMKKTTSVPEFNNLRISYDEDMIRRLALYNSLSIDDNKKEVRRGASSDLDGPDSLEEEYEGEELQAEEDDACSLILEEQLETISDKESEHSDTVMDASVVSRHSDNDSLESSNSPSNVTTPTRVPRDGPIEERVRDGSSPAMQRNSNLVTKFHADNASSAASDAALDDKNPDFDSEAACPSRADLVSPPTILLSPISSSGSADLEDNNNKLNTRLNIRDDMPWPESKMVGHQSLPDIVQQFGGSRRHLEEEDEWKVLPKFRERNYLGSDPRAATCRGKLQSKRSKLNMEINKELMLRSGAENLFKATTNKKLKETVALELSFVNSNLQLLKEQLAELNSSVEVYQANSHMNIPMIPLGLKETKEIELQEPFKDFILEHYSEDGGEYEDALAELQDLRQAIRTPTRDSHGIALLFQYYNHLYYVERRFFPPDRSLGIFFEWYDSLTGVPSCQKTVAFEKASVLFNIGGLYTQIGTKQDRASEEGLDSAVDNFLRAAGTFQYIHENFTNAPSMDLGPETLQVLVQLMCAQARECLFEKSQLALWEAIDEHNKGEEGDVDDEGVGEGEDDDELEEGNVDDEDKEEVARRGHRRKQGDPEPERIIDHYLEVGQEAAYVGEVYSKVSDAISQQQVKDYVPFTWISLVQVKREHYKALAHYYVAIGLIDHIGDLHEKTKETIQFLHDTKEGKHPVPETTKDRKYLGKAHLREALLLHEEALRINRMCRELRKKDQLGEVLRSAHDTSLNKYTEIDEEDDFQEVLDPPPVLSSTTYQLTLSYPDFSQYRVTDLFRSLGPVAVFSAKHHWSAPRTVQLRKREDEGYGFSVRGDAPVVVAGVETHSLAHIGGMREGDYLVGIGDSDVKWASHSEVVAAIKCAENSLKLRLVTPLNRSNSRNSYNKAKLGGLSPTSTTSSSSGLSSAGSSSGSCYPGDGGSGSAVNSPSPPLSESGGTGSRGINKLNFSLFGKKTSHHGNGMGSLHSTGNSRAGRAFREDFIEENVIYR